MDQKLEQKKANWELFCQAWSEPDLDKRMALLLETTNEYIIYNDENADFTGHEDLSSYMEQFQQKIPGAKFETISFNLRGYHCLIGWKLVDPKGKVLTKGHTYGRYVNAHKFQLMTYFLGTNPT